MAYSGTLRPTPPFLNTLRAELRAGIPILEYERHVNDPAFGVEVADLFLELL